MASTMANSFVLVCVLCATLCGAGNAQESVCEVNKTLNFLQVAPLAGLYGPVGTQYSKGLQSAFEEYNRVYKNWSCKPHLNLVVVNDWYDPFKAQAAVISTLNTTDIFAVVGVYSTKSALFSYQAAVDRRVPFVGARTGVMELRQPFQRYVLNFRASFFDESAAVVEYLIARQFRCIAIFWQDDEVGQAGFEGIKAALSSKSLEPCGQGRHTKLANTALLDIEISAFLKSMESSTIIPDAIVLATVDRPASAFIVRVRASWPNILVAGLSCANPDLLVASLNQTNPAVLQNLVFAQLTPLLTDTTVPLVSKYKNALAALDATLVPSTISIEGYIVGRLVIAAIERTFGNFSREAFLNSFYDTGFFNLDGIRCGPFLPGEVDGGCNQCMHQVMFVEPLRNGSLAYVQENQFLRFSTCGYKPFEWKRLVFGQSCTYTGIPGQTCRDFRNGLYAAFEEVNDGGGLRGSMKLQLVTNDDLDDYDIALQNNIDFLNDPNVFGLIGTSPHAIEQVMEQANAMKKPIFGAYSGVAAIRVPFQRSVINFRVHYGDEITAIVHYCYAKKIRKFSVLYENSTLGRDGKQELVEHLADKRLSVHSEGSYNHKDDLTDAIYSIFFGPQGLPEAVIVVGYADVLDEILLEAHALNREIHVFALSQTVTTELLDILSSSDAKDYLETVDLRRLVFTQTVPVVTDQSIPAVANYTSALADYNAVLSVSPAGFEGYLVGHLVASSIQRVMGDTVTTEKVVSAVYDSGSFNLFGTRCGPFLDASNTSSGCNQCMKRVWLTGISDNGKSYHLVDDSFSFTTCMYEPSPNLDFQLDGIRLLMVIIASIANGYVALVMIGQLVYRNNENIRSSIKFSLISCVGAMLSLSSVYLLYFIPTDQTCILEPWAADLSFVLLFGPLFSKTQRIEMLFNNKKMQRMRITDRQVLMYFLALSMVFVLQLIMWSIASPRRMVESWTLDGYRFESCKSPIVTFQYISWILKALVLLWGCFLCSRVFKLSGQFARLNESKEIAVSIYNTTFSALVALVLGFTVTDPNHYFLSFSSLLIVNTVVVVSVIFTGPLISAIRGVSLIGNDSDDASSTTASSPGSFRLGGSKNRSLAGSKSRVIMVEPQKRPPKVLAV